LQLSIVYGTRCSIATPHNATRTLQQQRECRSHAALHVLSHL
jgi:hypothetical protein